jgi:two-component system, OmpR family, response regulator
MTGPQIAPEAVRVLVVDDEPPIAELVSTALRYEGFSTKIAPTGRAALEALGTFRPELVVLDVQLPDIDGFEVQRRLRSDGHRVPVLFLTARDTTDDKVRGLTLGGDDYVTKPFSLEELLARIRAVLRRAGTDTQAAAVLKVGDLELDEEKYEVWRAGHAITLTPTEFKLLRYLMLNTRRVVSKGQILDHVWEYDFGGDAGIVETYISYLRKKLDVEGDGTTLIQTLRGVGYTLRPADD